MQDNIALIVFGTLFLTIQAFENVANIAAFFAVVAGLSGLAGRAIETFRIGREGNVTKDDRDIRLQNATTTPEAWEASCSP